jgi:signal transduction histidine kinase
MLQVTVEDSGIGFDASRTERMFDTFFTTKAQGTGMELSLCRSIVLGHNGRWWAALHVQLPTAAASTASD